MIKHNYFQIWLFYTSAKLFRAKW